MMEHKIVEDAVAMLIGHAFTVCSVDDSKPSLYRVSLESDNSRIEVVRERDEVSLRIAPKEGRKDDWVWIGVLRRVLDGDEGAGDVLDEQSLRFLNRRMPEVEFAFGEAKLREALISRLLEARRERADQQFSQLTLRAEALDDSANNSTREELLALVELLRSAGERAWVDRLSAIAGELASHPVFAHERLRSCFGSMGSLGDLVIHPMNGHNVAADQLKQVNARLDELRTALWNSLSIEKSADHSSPSVGPQVARRTAGRVDGPDPEARMQEGNLPRDARENGIGM